MSRLLQVHSSGTFSNNGAQVGELEARFADFFNVCKSRVVLTANATLGLEGLLAISATLDWHIPAWSFAATHHAVINAGKQFQLKDIESDSWQISVEDSASCGQLLVLPFGAPLTGYSWGEDDEVIIDAAASLGSMEGALGELPGRTSVVFSLHATKVLGVGEGGIVITGNATQAESLRSWINFGFYDSRIASAPGTNAKMSEYTAALLHTELDAWEFTRSDWLSARMLARAAEGQIAVQSQPQSSALVSPYWVVLLPENIGRNSIISALGQLGIQTRLWWGIGAHKTPYFAKTNVPELPNTDDIAARYLGLPFYRGIQEEDCRHIAEALSRLLASE